MQNREEVKISLAVIQVMIEPLDDTILDTRHIGHGLLTRWEGQIPSVIVVARERVADIKRIVELLRSLQEEPVGPQDPQEKDVIEKSHMPELPTKWINDFHFWYGQLLIR